MYTLIFICGGVYDSGKIGNSLDELIYEAKDILKNDFDPDYNQCVIIDSEGSIVFSYEHDVYNNS